MSTVLGVFQVFVCVVLIFLILMHSGKDAGLSGAFGVGTGGAACDAAAALTAGQLEVPCIVCRDSVVPALVGPDCLVVAVACGHRAEAFDACHALIDELKASVPVWKHQLFTDGSDEWVGSA